MKIVIHQQQKDLRIPTKSFRQSLSAFLDHKKVLCSTVIIHYVSKQRIAALHGTLFDDPTPTDCISLPIDSKDDDSAFSVLGEVFVCPKVAIEYSALHKKDPLAETFLYSIHGLLHLLGYDDIQPADRKVMRREEKKGMAFFKASLE